MKEKTYNAIKVHWAPGTKVQSSQLRFEATSQNGHLQYTLKHTCFLNDVAVGTILSTRRTDYCIELHALQVQPNYRRCGIGRAILMYLKPFFIDELQIATVLRANEHWCRVNRECGFYELSRWKDFIVFARGNRVL